MDRFVPYMENEQKKDIISKLKNENLSQKKIYVLGNQVEIYYLLNTLPITDFPLNFPWISQYFKTEGKIISEIKRKKIDCILIPLPLDSNYSHFNNLLDYINKNYMEKQSDNKKYRLFYLKK